MKTTTYTPGASGLFSAIFHKPQFLKTFDVWIESQKPIWEENRLGISATGIFIQVTFAGVMIAVLGMAGASLPVYTTGILFAFIANSLAFAQTPMKIILSMFLISILVNSTLTVYYALKMTGN